MRKAGVAALVAALTVGSSMALAENVPLPVPAPKKPSTQGPRPPIAIAPGPAVTLPVRMYTAIQFELTPKVAASASLLLALSVLVRIAQRLTARRGTPA